MARIVASRAAKPPSAQVPTSPLACRIRGELKKKNNCLRCIILEDQNKSVLANYIEVKFLLANVNGAVHGSNVSVSHNNVCLKFTIFLYLSPRGHFDIADPISMQDACHHELSKYDLCSPRVSQ